VDSTDIFTVVSSLAWIFGLALGYLFGYFAGRARSRRRERRVPATREPRVPVTREPVTREAVTVPLPRIAAR
jgi:membrane protein DedA with SNARE-associated domain